MKKIIKIILLSFLFFTSILFVSADYSIIYCNSTDPADPDFCSLDSGIGLVKGTVSASNIETTKSISQYVQDIVVYILGFVSVIAVILIIYAGFTILISSGEEEKLKKAKNLIIYVIVGIVVMWLAWALYRFIVTDVLNGGGGGSCNYPERNLCELGGCTWVSGSGCE